MVMMEAPVRKCPKCLGWGFWPLGDLCPIGEFDSQEFGDQVIKCPWCGNPPNGDDNKTLKKVKEKEDKDGKHKV